MKVIALGSVLAKRFGVQAAEGSSPRIPTIGDVDSTEALESYQAAKRAHKAKMRALNELTVRPHVVVYVTREHPATGADEFLVFDVPDEPEFTAVVPGGGIDEGESIEHAAVREVARGDRNRRPGRADARNGRAPRAARAAPHPPEPLRPGERDRATARRMGASHHRAGN